MKHTRHAKESAVSSVLNKDSHAFLPAVVLSIHFVITQSKGFIRKETFSLVLKKLIEIIKSRKNFQKLN